MLSKVEYSRDNRLNLERETMISQPVKQSIYNYLVEISEICCRPIIARA